jgi:hypothetical protein
LALNHDPLNVFLPNSWITGMIHQCPAIFPS